MDQNSIKVYTIVKNAIVLLSQKNKLTYFTGKDCLDKFFDHLIQHINHINKTKAKPNPHTNPNVYKSNSENTICLICNNKILT